MLSDEEKEIFNNLKEYMQDRIDNGYHKFIYNDLDWDFKCIDCINAIDNALNLIEKREKEIEHQKEKRENQKKELAILNEKQIEFNKLVNTVNSYKGQIKKLQDKCKELIFEKQELTSALLDSTPNDKIKVTIEELEKLNEEVTGNGFGFAIHYLKSLLKEE